MIVKTIAMIIISILFVPVTFAFDAENGKAKSASCSACHNANMNNLAGKSAADIEAGIKSILSGNKAHPPLGELSDQDVKDIAGYLSSS
jgi:cytochrome c553